MAEYQNRVRPQSALATGVAIDAGLRAYMLKVYNYMLLGLALTGGTAWFVSSSETMLRAVLPWMFPLMLVQLGLVFFLSFRINRLSVGTAQLLFWAYAGLMGVWLAPVLLVYTGASVAQVFFITSATFGAMSLYGYTTGRDLAGFGSFLFMGLIGLLIAMVVNMFLGSSMLDFIISAAGVLIFTGLTAWDTQKIKEMYVANDDGTVMGRKAIMGALNLYLDFLNLFLMLLRLLGDRR